MSRFFPNVYIYLFNGYDSYLIVMMVFIHSHWLYGNCASPSKYIGFKAVNVKWDQYMYSS